MGTDDTASPGCAPWPGTSLVTVGGAADAELRSPSSSARMLVTAASGAGRWWPEGGAVKGIEAYEAYQGPGPLPGSRGRAMESPGRAGRTEGGVGSNFRLSPLNTRCRAAQGSFYHQKV